MALIGSADGEQGGLCRGQWSLTERKLTMITRGREPEGTYVVLTGEVEPLSKFMFLWNVGETASVFVQIDWYLSKTEMNEQAAG